MVGLAEIDAQWEAKVVEKGTEGFLALLNHQLNTYRWFRRRHYRLNRFLWRTGLRY